MSTLPARAAADREVRFRAVEGGKGVVRVVMGLTSSP
jgi:hypothetical protein